MPVRGKNKGIKVDLDLTVLHRINKNFPAVARKATRRGADLILKEAQDRTPTGRRERGVDPRWWSPHMEEFGPLKETWRVEFAEQGSIGRASGIVAQIGSDSPVALWLEYGTEDHDPVDAEYLKFFIDGEWIYAKEVAGIEPQPILTPAFYNNLDLVIDIYIEMLGDYLERSGRERSGAVGTEVFE